LRQPYAGFVELELAGMTSLFIGNLCAGEVLEPIRHDWLEPLPEHVKLVGEVLVEV
jgi:hypothetical protein